MSSCGGGADPLVQGRALSILCSSAAEDGCVGWGRQRTSRATRLSVPECPISTLRSRSLESPDPHPNTLAMPNWSPSPSVALPSWPLLMKVIVVPNNAIIVSL